MSSASTPTSSAATVLPANSANAIFAIRAEAPTRRLPVISFSSAYRTDASEASSHPATTPGSSPFGVLSSVCTTSVIVGTAMFVGRPGHISATVSAKSPT